MIHGRIRAAFFDVGGTLVQPWPSVGEVYAGVVTRHGIHKSAGELELCFRESWKALKTGSLTVSRKEWWRQLVFRTLACEDEACFEELYEAFARPAAWRLFPDALDALREARSRGLHVGVISNWDCRLRPLLTAMGVGQLFDSMTISCDVGVEKPDARIFTAALAVVGVEPSEAFHVGDSYEEDVVGATAAGMQAILIDRGDTKSVGKKVVKDLREVFA